MGWVNILVQVDINRVLSLPFLTLVELVLFWGHDAGASSLSRISVDVMCLDGVLICLQQAWCVIVNVLHVLLAVRPLRRRGDAN